MKLLMHVVAEVKSDIHICQNRYIILRIYIQLSCEFHRLLMIFAIPHSYPMPILIHCSDVE